MAISLANNLLSNAVALNLNKNQDALQSSVTKLSSGLRINTAADDPSGLAIAEKLQSQVNGFDQAVLNVQDATNAATVAEGALQTTTDILQRVRSLAIEASSDITTSTDKTNLQTEVTQLLQEVNSISQNTNFNGASLLDGSHTGFQQQVLAFTKITTNASLAAATTSAVGVGVNSVLLAASVIGIGVSGAATGFQSLATSAAGVQGLTVGAATGGSVDGTILLQVINTGTSIAVQESFIASNSIYGSSVATTLLANGSNTTTFDNVSITLGNFQTSDVGATSYIKVSQNVPLISTASGPAFSFQSGANEGATIQLGIVATNSASLRLSNINLLISTPTGTSLGAEDAIGQIDNALVSLLAARANLGAITVRLQKDSDNDNVAATNLQASESNIRDLNISTETTKYTADQILISVGTSVLLQSNNNAQSVERLFQ